MSAKKMYMEQFVALLSDSSILLMVWGFKSYV